MARFSPLSYSTDIITMLPIFPRTCHWPLSVQTQQAWTEEIHTEIKPGPASVVPCWLMKGSDPAGQTRCWFWTEIWWLGRSCTGHQHFSFFIIMHSTVLYRVELKHTTFAQIALLSPASHFLTHLLTVCARYNTSFSQFRVVLLLFC